MSLKLRRTAVLAFPLLLLFVFAGYFSHAQVVYENPKHQIYEFLSRQAQKGNIDFDDLIQPVSRKQIASHLATLQDSVHRLSAIEKKELAFYQREFSEFNESLPDSTTFLKKDPAGRLRFLSVKKGDFILRGDPSLFFGLRSSGLGTSYTTAGGLQLWGHVNKNLTFQAYFQDFNESGKGMDTSRAFSAEPGVLRIATTNTELFNYSDFRGNLTYSWNNGSVSVGYDKMTYGYGETGRLILSDKAPAYPFIRLDYRPLKWLGFNYSHSFLQSDVVDSARTNNKGNDLYGTDRELFVPKFMASHSLNFYPVKGLSLSLGESMVYSDRLEVGYLLPVMFFKVYDQYASRNTINSGSNSQFFFQASSRNHLRNTHIYGTLFIDEIRMSEAFNAEKSRNQLGFNLGASITDIGIPYLTLGAEYTRVNPFVYNNLIPAQTYTHQGYTMGEWMGANSDRLMGYLKYTPASRVKTTLMVQKIRKGDPGNLQDQYLAEPQPKFLESYYRDLFQVQFRVSYEWLNNLYFDANALWSDDKNYMPPGDQKLKQLQFSIRLGM